MMDRTSATNRSVKNFVGIGEVTRERVSMRAQELAVLAGRAPPYVTQTDYEQAKREVTGESEIDRQEAMLEPGPETKRWASGDGLTDSTLPAKGSNPP